MYKDFLLFGFMILFLHACSQDAFTPIIIPDTAELSDIPETPAKILIEWSERTPIPHWKVTWKTNQGITVYLNSKGVSSCPTLPWPESQERYTRLYYGTEAMEGDTLTFVRYRGPDLPRSSWSTLLSIPDQDGE